uniref:Tr-type G domain-containing protein n=1 Tax=Sphenodon punctatus TaxID=8508 RepID=A0A8D0GRG1_SPHPU
MGPEHIRCVGHSNSFQRIFDRDQILSAGDLQNISSFTQPRQTRASAGGDHQAPPTGGHREGAVARARPGGLLDFIPRAEKIRLVEGSARPKASQQGATQATLQDGDTSLHIPSPFPRRLDGISRPAGRLPPCSHPSGTQEVAPVLLRRPALAVSSPPLRTGIIPSDLHQGSRPPHSGAPTGGDSGFSIPRRSASYRSVPAAGPHSSHSYLSWALDTNQEEREKGKTVEVGRAYFETEKKHFTILDAPGHKSFVPNMIGGASQADLAVLVISARKGEFETVFEKGGQTREHAMLAKTAGVKHLIVLINKMDDPTVNWSTERYEECKEKLVPFLKKVGFNPKKDIHFMPCSGLTGANLKEQSDFCPWYIGLPFIPYLDNLPNFNRSVDGPIRLPIVDKYKDMGTVVLGKLESGSICKGQQLVMMPNKHNVEVLGILSDDVETDAVAPGENLKIRLKGIEEEEILPGFILCDPNNLCHSGRTFDAQVRFLKDFLVIFLCLEALICLVDKKSGEKSKTRPRFVKQDQVCIARLRTAGTICLETFKDFPQMGRFTLRDEGKTIAIGKVLKLVPEKD